MTSKTISVACFICVLLVFTPVLSSAQSEGQESKSLADLAREQRLKKDKDVKQPAKVYSNEDMPSHPPDEPSTPSSANTSGAGTKKASGDADSDSNASASAPHDEKYFHNKMSDLRKYLETDKARLATLQKELDDHYADAAAGGFAVSGHEGVATNKVNTSWTTDPIGYHNHWVAEGHTLHAGIDSQEKKVAADEKAISDFVDQCRHEDCQPGWIR